MQLKVLSMPIQYPYQVSILTKLCSTEIRNKTKNVNILIMLILGLAAVISVNVDE